MAESECCDDYDDLSECDEIGDLQEGVDIINSLPLSEDDDEPYCICLEPNNQHMIACDGEKCEIQWYHFTNYGDFVYIPLRLLETSSTIDFYIGYFVYRGESSSTRPWRVRLLVISSTGQIVYTTGDIVYTI